MTTEIINFSDYRKNLSSLWKKSSEKKVKYLVLVHWKPAFEVNPVFSNTIDDDWTEYTEKNHKAWLEAKKDLEAWDVYDIEDLKLKYL